jgi:lactaldehyde reductase
MILIQNTKYSKTMAVNRFILNEVSYFGPGARKELPGVIARLSFKKALVVTDKGLIEFGVAKMVCDVLEEANIPYKIFSEVKPNPTVANVKAGIEAFKLSGADFIIAIGGGSSMDTAKGIGIVINNPEFEDIVSLEGCAPTKNKTVPIIALPTTAGTAAETTINYVIIDEKQQKKMVCVDPNDIPCVAIVDAELMYSLPKLTTAATGMDALTHAIEGYITKGAWEMSDMFEIEAIRMINKYLRTAVFEPRNPEGRNGMAVAQYIAGMAFSNVGLGVVHGMAHPMGSLFDIPHGVANALLLPTVMEFNAPACKEKYVEIAKAMNAYKEGMSMDEAVDAACKAVRDLAVEVGIPQHLTELGIKASDIPALAEQAITDVCTPGNPREVTKEDIIALYTKVL